MTLVHNVPIPVPSYHKRDKTGLRPCFYLNCSHIHQQVFGLLRLPGTYATKIDENQTPLACLILLLSRPYFKNLRGVF